MEKIKDLIVKHVWSRPLRHRPEDSFILRIVRNFCQFILLISLFVLIYAFIVTLGWIKGAAMSLISVACSAVYWLTTSYLGRLSSGWIKKPMLAKAFAYGVRAAVSLALIFWLFDFFLQSGAVGNMTNTMLFSYATTFLSIYEISCFSQCAFYIIQVSQVKKYSF